MPKKYYPGGFRLTKKTAAALAVRELGTARGKEELEEILRAEQMAATMEKYTPHKAIGDGSGKGDRR